MAYKCTNCGHSDERDVVPKICPKCKRKIKKNIQENIKCSIPEREDEDQEDEIGLD